MSFTHSRVGSKDANHDPLRNMYVALGCSVYEVHRVPAFVDLVIGVVGITQLVEVKTEDGDVSPRQQTFARDWRGGRPQVIRTEDDVIRHVQALRKSVK